MRSCDLAGARTQDPLLKREMLYQLSYQVLFIFNKAANIKCLIYITMIFLIILIINSNAYFYPFKINL